MQGTFYDDQIFNACRFMSDLIRKAKHSIVLIDNYVDDSVLLLQNSNCWRILRYNRQQCRRKDIQGHSHLFYVGIAKLKRIG